MSVELNIDADTLMQMMGGSQPEGSINQPSTETQSDPPARKRRPAGKLPRVVEEARQRQEEERARRAQMEAASRGKSNSSVPNQKGSVSPLEMPTYESAEGRRRVIIGGRVRYVPAQSGVTMVPPSILPDFDDVIQPVKVDMPQAPRTPNRPSSLTRVPRPPVSDRDTPRLPRFIADKVQAEARQRAVSSARTLAEVRRIRMAQDVEPIVGDDVRKYTLSQLRAARAKQLREERTLLKTVASQGPKETPREKILNDPTLSNIAKAVAIRKLSNDPRRTLTLRRDE